MKSFELFYSEGFWFCWILRGFLYLWNPLEELVISKAGDFWFDDPQIPHVIQEAYFGFESVGSNSLNIPMSRSICFLIFSSQEYLRSRVFSFSAKWVTNKSKILVEWRAEADFPREKIWKIWGKIVRPKLNSWEIFGLLSEISSSFEKISWLENQFIIFCFSYNLIKFLSGFMKALIHTSLVSWKSLIQILVSSGRKPKNDCRTFLEKAWFEYLGSVEIWVTISMESCDSGSKVLMLSISFTKKALIGRDAHLKMKKHLKFHL